MRFLLLFLILCACDNTPQVYRDGVIITDSTYQHLENLPLEEMDSKLDSVVIISKGSLPTQAGDTLTLEAEVFWKSGSEPDDFMLVWNLESCALGEVRQCNTESKYIDVGVIDGHIKVLKDVPLNMQYSVTVGIAVALRKIGPSVS